MRRPRKQAKLYRKKYIIKMKANKPGYISVLNIVDINRKKIFITEKKC